MVTGLGGERVFSLSLFLSSRDPGSELYKAPIAYVLGNVQVSSTPEAAPQKDNVEVVTFGLLPEISHTFKEDQPAPNGFLAMMFSLGLLGLWAPFASQSLSLGINVQNAFNSGALGLYGSAFMGLLALSTGLLYAYWTVLRVLPFLGYASVLGTLLVFVGQKALVARHALRLLQSATPATKKTL
jgi:hypothetical protein